MTRFSLKRLLLAITLVGGGVGMAWRLYQHRTDVIWFGESELWLLCGAVAGAGFGQLYPRRGLGVALGAVVGTAIQAYLASQGALVGHV